MIGAEIFIEPGQTPEEIDLWFRRLKEAGMAVARIRMFEAYMHKTDGSWDFSLFDIAFKAGEKYEICIYANLFPLTDFTDIGGFKFPRDEGHLQSISEYIQHVVLHFKQFKSLYGWVPINEPGATKLIWDEMAVVLFDEWRAQQPSPNSHGTRYPHFDFEEERFLLYYNTWYIKWLCDEIFKHDPDSIVHVNNHAIFQNVAGYDFPEWCKFITSLGGSAHASWHFGYFERSGYALAVSANSEILRSGAGSIPWFMTELQGGNNTYSGFLPLCPTAEEIAQWLWIVIAAESRGAIFWCLNPRSSGIEAGEWAMLNYHNEPSDRMLSASKVISAINKHKQLFEGARVKESGINILYARESLWIEKKLQIQGKSVEGRDEGSVMKSALAYFEALSENGIQTNFKEISEFDFLKADYSGISIILAHQISIPSKYWKLLEGFVRNGGKLLVDGLTGYYDEHAVCLMRIGFPLQDLFGGDLLEYKAIDRVEDVDFGGGIKLPFYLWKGIIKATTGTVLAHDGTALLAIKNKLGSGEVCWSPSLVGLGSRILKDYSQLGHFLKRELGFHSKNIPFFFREPQKGVLMKTMVHGKYILTVLVSKLSVVKGFSMEMADPYLEPEVIFSTNAGTVIGNVVRISPEETMVVKWG